MNGDKPSIKDRIIVREDAGTGTKRIKVEAVKATDGQAEDKPADTVQLTERPKKDPSKVRCHFWPNCTNKECVFVHPKEVVE